jgi:putative addiction module component (TIGR02574 family)
MPMDLDELELEAMKLPSRARAHLAEVLIASLDEDVDAEHERVWAEEAERRFREIQEGQVQTRPADEVLARLRAALR